MSPLTLLPRPLNLRTRSLQAFCTLVCSRADCTIMDKLEQAALIVIGIVAPLLFGYLLHVLAR